MPGKGNTTETLIVLSMLDRIIMDDLLQERELEVFEEKKNWYDLWRRQVNEIYDLEANGDLLGWDKLKDTVVEWLKENRAIGDRQAILDRCLAFLPYGPLPYHQGKGPGGPSRTGPLTYHKGKGSGDLGRTGPMERKFGEQGKIQASPEARELSLEKICRLLGLEDKWQELFPSQLV